MTDEQLSATFAALADPTRRAILARLAQGEATVNELARPFSTSFQTISKHLRVLARAGLVTRSRDAGTWRPCRIEVAPLEGASEWIDGCRASWRDQFDPLEREIHDIRYQRHEHDHGRD